MRCGVLALILTVVFSAPANAQQVNSTIGASNVPAGVTVLVSAAVPVSAWIDSVTYSTKSESEADKFAQRLRDAGVSPADIAIVPIASYAGPQTNVTAKFSPALWPRIEDLARTENLNQQQFTTEPANEQDLYNRALALAIENGRKAAAAIAAADHQHIGRLLNYVPSPVEMAKQMAAAAPAGLLMAGGSSATITANGIATFQLVP
jgi:hypothetical protein